jgi:hypothetical protein
MYLGFIAPLLFLLFKVLGSIGQKATVSRAIPVNVVTEVAGFEHHILVTDRMVVLFILGNLFTFDGLKTVGAKHSSLLFRGNRKSPRLVTRGSYVSDGNTTCGDRLP